MRKAIDHLKCPDCNGTGDARAHAAFPGPCRICGGTGRLSSPEQWDRILSALERRAEERRRP